MGDGGLLIGGRIGWRAFVRGSRPGFARDLSFRRYCQEFPNSAETYGKSMPWQSRVTPERGGVYRCGCLPGPRFPRRLPCPIRRTCQVFRAGGGRRWGCRDLQLSLSARPPLLGSLRPSFLVVMGVIRALWLFWLVGLGIRPGASVTGFGRCQRVERGMGASGVEDGARCRKMCVGSIATRWRNDPTCH